MLIQKYKSQPIRSWVRSLGFLFCLCGAIGQAFGVGITDSSKVSVDKLVRIVASSSSVVTYKNEVLIADWRVKQRFAEDAPQVSFNTSGKFPIADSIDSVRDRVADADRRYLDGIFQVSKSIYDWGRNDSLVAAEQSRRRSAELLYEMTFEAEFAKLLSLVINHLKVEEQLGLLNGDLEFLEQTLKVVRKRYEAGAGSLDDVRHLELRRLDIVRDREQALNLLTKIDETIEQLFDEDVVNLQAPVLEVIKELPKLNLIQLEPMFLMASKKSEVELTAIDYELKSILSEKKPSVTGTITSRLFNITTEPMEEYEIYGGIEIKFPVYDGGARDARIEGLNVQKVVARSQLHEELDRIDEQWFELSTEQDDKETLIGQEEQRVNTLTQRISALKKRLEAIQVTIVDLTDVELSRSQSDRSLKSMKWDLVRIAVQKADLADKLLSHFTAEIPF